MEGLGEYNLIKHVKKHNAERKLRKKREKNRILRINKLIFGIRTPYFGLRYMKRETSEERECLLLLEDLGLVWMIDIML